MGSARRTWIALVGAGATLALAAAPAWSGSPPPAQTVTITPTVVRDGDTLTISGTGCIDPDDGSTDDLEVAFIAPGFARPSAGNPQGLFARSTVPAPDGTFLLQVVVDNDESVFGPYEDYTAVFSTACFRGGPEGEQIGSYPDVTVTYDGTADDAPATTEPAPEAPAPAPAPPPAAAPAEARRADPTFTG